PLRYFDRNDILIFAKKSKSSRDFNQALQDLPKEIQLLLKRVYFHAVDTLDHDIMLEPGKYAHHLSRREILDSSARGLGKFYKVERKPLDQEPDVDSHSTVYDILKQAKLYGIKYSDLKGAKEELEMWAAPDYDQRLKAWRDIKQRIMKANYKRQKARNLMYR